MKTWSVKPADVKKQWVTVDAAGKTLGRLASEIAYVLRGKHRPTFTPHLDTGDNVIVTNAEKVHLTGKKWDKKYYYNHSTFIGGLRAIAAKDLIISHPERLIKFAVRGMMPKNKLAKKVIMNLKVCKGQEHPHAPQNPQAMPSRLVKN